MMIAIPEDEWEVFADPTPSVPGWNAEGLGGESASIDPPKEPSWPEATANGTGERGEDRARLHSPAMAGPEEEDVDPPSKPSVMRANEFLGEFLEIVNDKIGCVM